MTAFTRTDPPTVTYIAFDWPRPVTDWYRDGKADEGCEANGTVLRYEVIEALNAAARDRQPCQCVVIGERRFSDGRHFLDFAMNPRWMEAATDFRWRNEHWTYVCPDCDGMGDDHRKITVEGLTVRCPRDPRPDRSSRR